MMKLVNRLLIIAVVAFGAWFVVQHWDSVEAPTENVQGEELVIEGTEDGEIVLDMDSDLTIEEQLEALRAKPVVVPARTITYPVTQKKEEVITLDPSAEVTVYLFEGGFDLSQSTITEGRVVFTVRNDGRMAHEFAVKGKKDFGRIKPGSQSVFELDLVRGEYELFSPRALDQQLDMRETLTVEAAQ